MNDHRKPAVAVAVMQGDRVLLGYNEARRGWELIGGKQHGDEPMLVAARRELVEETGLTLPGPLRFVGYTDAEPDWLCLVFFGELPGGATPEVREPHKVSRFRWSHLSELPGADDLTYAMRRVVAKHWMRLNELSLDLEPFDRREIVERLEEFERSDPWFRELCQLGPGLDGWERVSDYSWRVWQRTVRHEGRVANLVLVLGDELEIREVLLGGRVCVRLPVAAET